jgi:lysylphosphatidylglycerol synthetase-like protein (DUF2156 family)
LVLYLVDSIAHGRFVVGAVAVGVILALFLSLTNSFIKPLHRVRTRTQRALIVVALTVLMNLVIIQVFAWIGPLHANFVWVLLTAAFVALIAGAINWQIGFNPPPKSRRATRTSQARTREQARERSPKRA